MNQLLAFIMVTVISTVFCVQPISKLWNFEDVEPGTLPEGWETMSAFSSGDEAINDNTEAHAFFKVVKAPIENNQENNALKLFRHENAVYQEGHHCYQNSPILKNGTISVKVMAEDTLKGHCGVTFRMKDHRNFYAVRYCIIEANIILIKLQDGKWEWIRSTRTETNEAKNAGEWYELKVNFQDNVITVYLNGEKKFTYTDDSPLDYPGKVGLFSRGADSIILYDDFYVQAN